MFIPGTKPGTTQYVPYPNQANDARHRLIGPAWLHKTVIVFHIMTQYGFIANTPIANFRFDDNGAKFVTIVKGRA